MEKNRQPDFLNENIGKLLFQLAIPAIFAQLVNALYNIVDRIYIGRIEGIGEAALGGVGVSFPVIILITAFTALIGMGGTPLASIKMGEGNNDGAEKILSNCFTTLLFLGVFLFAFFYTFKVPILQLFGAKDPEILFYANQYLSIYLFGTIFVMISLGMNAFINGQGFAKIGMLTVGIGATINIVLDPILIFGLNMGVQGGALATVISQFVSAMWALQFLFGKKSVLKIRRKYLMPDRKILLRIVALGMAPFIMQSTESLVQIVFNNSLMIYGGKEYVSSMTILTACMQMALMPLMGITQGAQPIIGYNFGAGRYDRVRKATRYSIGSCFGVSTFVCLVCVFGSHLVTGIFTADVALQLLAGEKLKIFMAGVWVFGIQSACQNSFIALGKAKTAIFLALLRKIILLIPLVLLLPGVIGMGVDGVYWAEPIADVVAAIATATLFSFEYRRLGRMQRDTVGGNLGT